MSCRQVLGQLYVEMMVPSSGTPADVIDSEDAGASLSSGLRLFFLATTCRWAYTDDSYDPGPSLCPPCQ